MNLRYDRPVPQIVMLLVLAIALVACSDNALQTAADINSKYATGLAAVQATARKAHETQKADGTLVLSDANYKVWLETGIKLNQGGKEVNAYLRDQAKLSPEARSTASSMIATLAKTVQDSINNDVVTITDSNLRQQIQTGLLTIQTALNSASAALAVGGN